MRLWHDDIREAPEGWVVARTNAEAMHYLRTGEVTEISLDHDLGLQNDTVLPEDVDELIDLMQERAKNQENGLDLVKWMVLHNHVPETIRIHSWNPPAAKEMAAYLNDHGYDCVVAPY